MANNPENAEEYLPGTDFRVAIIPYEDDMNPSVMMYDIALVLFDNAFSFSKLNSGKLDINPKYTLEIYKK